MHNIKKPLLVWFLLYTCVSFSQPVISGQLQKWHTVTLTFNGPSTAENASLNPFLDYRLDVTFTSPSGKRFLVPGFYAADGNAAESSANSGNKWRVRFTPNETGEWRYGTSFRSGTNVAVSENATAGSATSFNGATGTFVISASTKSKPDNRARGRLNYVGERYLKFEDTGEYFLKAGSDSPENLLAYNDFDNTVGSKTWSPHAQDWNTGDPTWKGNNGKELIGAINYLSEKGMNAFSFLTMNVIGDGKDVWPWAAATNADLDGNSSTEKGNRTRYDVSKLAQWEILFSHADTKGMYLHFKTQETENDQLLDGGDLGVERKLYYRELIARFGHHLALNWNLGEEHDIYQELNDPQNTRVKSYASFFKANDPYNHHIVIHSYPESSHQEKLFRPLLGNQSDLTGASAQLMIDAVHVNIKKWVLASKSSGKQWVVANDEQGGAQSGVTTDAGFGGDKGNQPDNRKDTRHKVLWGTFMAGGAGVEYYFGYQTGETDLTAQNLRSRDLKWDDAKVALDFFNTHLRFWEMETNDELTSRGNDYCLAKTNDTYVIYLPSGGSTNLNLSNATGNFTIKWFDPISGGNLVNGSVTQISGGGNQSIGNPPHTSSSDWVVLVQKEGGGINTPDTDDCSVVLNAMDDFSYGSIDGFSPAYVDATRKALAIDASQFQNTFAAVETPFKGQTGTYTIGLHTLTELDGESTYRVKINGNLIGTFTNPTTTVDYVPAQHTFPDISVQQGDIIRVEFSSDTNGKIPEGNGTAFSRGRWTSLRFACQSDILDPPTGNCDADAEEENGIVVIEAEGLTGATGWVNSTAVNGFTGDGYIDWQGANSFHTPGQGTISAKIKINTPGTYLFQWRSKVGEGTNTTESNDSWLRFPDADDFYGQKGSDKVYPKGSGKTPNPEGASANGWFKVYLGGTTNWTWASSTSDNDAHKIYVKFDKAATYTMEISGRSKHHLIDRIVLSKGDNNATDLSLEETLCTSGDTMVVPVSSVSLSPSNTSVVEGNSINLKVSVLPQNATNKKVIWTSSDASIATVAQNGTVTALKIGTVIITAVSEDGGLRSQSTIKVIEKPIIGIPVSGIYITKQRLTLVAGESTQLTYRIRPSNATNTKARWKSSDTSIATVTEDGVVTALKEGVVEIEAVSEDGGYRSDSNVTVLPKSDGIRVKRVYVTPQTLQLNEGETAVLSYLITPLNATNKDVVWVSGDTSIATVDATGTVTALRPGTVEIEATTVDGQFRSDATVKVVSLSNDGNAAIIAYPNPTHDEVRIEGIQSESGLIGVYSFNGVLLKQQTVKREEAVVISLAGQPAGSYVLQIIDGNEATTKVLVKM